MSITLTFSFHSISFAFVFFMAFLFVHFFLIQWCVSNLHTTIIFFDLFASLWAFFNSGSGVSFLLILFFLHIDSFCYFNLLFFILINSNPSLFINFYLYLIIYFIWYSKLVFSLWLLRISSALGNFSFTLSYFVLFELIPMFSKTFSFIFYSYCFSFFYYSFSRSFIFSLSYSVDSGHSSFKKKLYHIYDLRLSQIVGDIRYIYTMIVLRHSSNWRRFAFI